MNAERRTVPFCWQDKRTLRKIREQCPRYVSALAVYHALTEVASDKQSDEFTTTHDWLAQLCGYGRRTVLRRLPDLERIGVVQISTPAMKAPCTYRLRRTPLRCATKSQRCDSESTLQSHTSEEREEKIPPTAMKERSPVPSVNGRGGLKEQFYEKMAEESKP